MDERDDEDIDRRCANGDTCCYDGDHAYSRHLCSRCSHGKGDQEHEKEEEDEEDRHRLSDNCGASCDHYRDDGDHDYARRLCAVCSQRSCCRSCKRRLPDVVSDLLGVSTFYFYYYYYYYLLETFELRMLIESQCCAGMC